eukprot:CAMPEP_0194033580 /NCGR_PEP_ID=MMETSP0009_2-20130614/6218_1 /TAXON_ID=210454 /ORGANISM="Grammatophora oceanica, Strain CCMP 410" /LENGTH=199 /DNA_ID=CAMNT_0038674295 /DNA_START=266 /DNA_END=865 /DNA_ORIENTATION=+
MSSSNAVEQKKVTKHQEEEKQQQSVAAPFADKLRNSVVRVALRRGIVPWSTIRVIGSAIECTIVYSLKSATFSINSASTEAVPPAGNGGEEVNPPLAEEELDMVAYPVPIIIFFPDVSGKFYDKRPKTFRAPQGKNYFTVRDLARTLAAYERGCKSPVPVKEHCSATRDFFGTNHIFFEGLYKAKGKDGKTGWRPFYAS